MKSLLTTSLLQTKTNKNKAISYDKQKTVNIFL